MGDCSVGSADGQKRQTVHYSGRVQGVGFRYNTRHIAEQFAVTGFVQNLDDGRVLVVVEGAGDEVERFLAQLRVEMSRYIRDVQSISSPATGEFEDFFVQR